MRFVFAFAAVFLLFSVDAENSVFTFDTEPVTGNGKITSEWWQNRAENFRPFGQAELIPLKFNKNKNALKITAGGKVTEVFVVQQLPVNFNSKFKLEVIFMGSGTMRPGFYGYDANNSFSEYQATEFKIDTKAWDGRQVIFSIRKPETVKIRPFVSAIENDIMIYSQLTFEKLADEDEYLLPSYNLKLWQERTRGTNLAKGKPVSFFPEPNYKSTQRGNSDATDLTDGNFNGSRDQLWFDPAAVAWFNAFKGVNIIVDLGEVQPVKKVVIRICGGRLPENNIKFPKYLQAFVSKDGKDFYQTSSLTKLNESEYELSNWKTHYFLKESNTAQGTPYVYPFELPISSEARYVVIHSPYGKNWVTMASDELAIIREDATVPGAGYNLAYTQVPQELFHQDLRIRPRLDTFYLADNMAAPNWLIVDDHLDHKKGAISYSINLPDSIKYTHDAGSYPADTRILSRTDSAAGRTTYFFKTNYAFEKFIQMVTVYRFGPFWFKAPATEIPAAEKYAEFTTLINEEKHYSLRLPIEVISIPKAPVESKEFKTLINYRHDLAINWPDFLETQRHIGMGTIQFLMPGSMNSEKARELYHKAKNAGFRIRHFTVPTLYLTNKYRNEPEYRCIGMPETMFGFCPSYRGKYFTEILEMITSTVREMPPDYITFEDECWQPEQMNHILDCERCQEYRKKIGMEEKRFVQWVQADFLQNYKTAVIAGLNGHKYPSIGHYGFDPLAPGYSCRLGAIPHLGGFDLYPEGIDEWHMSYYGNEPNKLQQIIRRAFVLLKDPKRIVPFITAGTGSYCEKPMGDIPEQLIMEAIMNGAGGFQIYYMPGLESPLDYFFIARAMQRLLPFENFLMKAELVIPEATNPKLAYTARRLNNTMLMLVGNYGAFSDAETVLKLPAKPQKIIDLVSGNMLTAEENLNLSVAKDTFRFLSLSFEK